MPLAVICRLNLPNNPTYRKVNPADAPIMIVALTSDVYDHGRLYDAPRRSCSRSFRRLRESGKSLSAAVRCRLCG